ncbi:MAG: hypothetical protein H7263_17290 [Candidatus Sericytochromatia bacterium]|nr:hypothetical protein [Candidatus Sericytochromatia bacterium]
MEVKVFENIEEIKTEINNIEISYIQLYDQIMFNYSGMIERYELESSNYGENIFLAHIFECRGLDWSGHALYKELRYKFNSIQDLIGYLINKHNITIQNMNGNFPENMPTQMDSSIDEKIIFKQNWDKFIIDFEKGKFLDNKLKLVS